MSGEQYHNITVSSENVTEYRALKRGDQIAVEEAVAGIVYYHHGIFLGHEKGVASFVGTNRQNAKLRKQSLLQFTDFGKKRLVRIIYPDGQCLPPEEAAENAENFLKEPNKWDAYDLLKNNCEHFATKCKTGIAFSQQVIQTIRELFQLFGMPLHRDAART